MFKLKFSVIVVVLTLIFNTSLKAQISGTVTVPGTYSTVASAVSAINTLGISGPLTVLITSGYIETAPVGGYTLTGTGTASNPIIFQKNGTGTNPLLNAYAGGIGLPNSAIQDGVFRFVGSDYITIDGIDIADPNGANPATMEFGYGFFKGSAIDGCQNNTIKNCVITLKRINNTAGAGPALEGSRGIELVDATTATHTTAIVVTSISGTNSNNKFYSNTIQNCNIGVSLSGYAAGAPYTLADTGNDIGGNSTATGNTIVNYGGGVSANPAAAVRTASQYNLNVSCNTINNNNGAPGAANHANILRGIYLGAATSANSTVNNNTITVKGAATSATVAAIENAAGSTPSSNTITINSNVISNCSYSTATSGGFYFILNNATAAFLNINSNSMSGLVLNPAAGNGLVAFIYNNAIVGTALSVNSNTLENTSNLNTTGNIYGIYTSNATQNYTIQSNYVNNISRSGGLAGNFYGTYNNNNSATAGTALITNNIFSNLSQSSTSVFYGIYQSSSTSQNEIVSSNLLTNITAGSGTSYIIYHSYGNSLSAISNNTVSNIFSIGGITGIFWGNNGAVSLNVDNNLVYGMSTTSSSNISGMWQLGGSFTYIFKNKIYDITGNGTASAAYGMYFVSGGNNYIYNNIIGDIKAPSSSNPGTLNCIAGLFFQGGGNYFVNYNTVRLDAASGGAAFYSSAVYAYTVPTVSMRNNILINNSISNSGVATAYRRNGNLLSSYAASSNNNLFYAGGPGTSYIFWDNVTPRPTLTSYTTFVSPKDAASVTENTNFLSLTGSSPTFLHIDPLIVTLAESGAVNIAGTTDDFDADIRQGNTGYIGTGSAPDIGADEFNNVITACNSVTSPTLSPLSQTKCIGQTASFSASGFTTGSGITYQWQVSPTSGGPYSNVVGGAGMNSATGYTTGALSAGTYYYVLLTTCTVSALSATSNEGTLTVNSLPTISVNSGAICSGQSFTMVPSGASTYTFTGGSAVVSPTTTTSYSVIGTSTAGCVSSATAVSNVTVNTLPIITVNSGTVCAGQSFTMVPSGAGTYTFTGGSAVVNPTTTTSYSVTGTSTAGCVSSAAAVSNLTVTALPVVTVNSGTICAGQSFTMTAGGASTYTYSSGSAIVSPTANSTYTVTGTSVQGCISSSGAISSVTVNAGPTLSVNSGSICSGNSFTLIPSGASTYTFQGGSATVSPGSTTSYTVIGTSIQGCVSSAPATSSVTVNPTPTISAAGGAICPGNSFTLSPSGASTYTFSSGPVVSPAVTTSYSVTGTSVAGCISLGSAVATVTVSNTLTVTITGSATVCSGDPVNLTAGGATTYTWNTTATTTTISPTPLINTTYSVIGSSGSCSNTALFSVTVNPTPIVSAVTSNSLICIGQTATLTGNGALTYTWNPGGIGTSISVSPTVTSTYTISGIDANGCMNSNTFTQNVSGCVGIGALGVENSEFGVWPNPTTGSLTIKGKTGSEVHVYNLLGSLIYETKMESERTGIDLSKEKAGIYFVRIDMITKKIVKE
jgi:hypothetical protein